MKAYMFTGQGSQHPGMGKTLYETKELAREFFESANKILDYDIMSMMFEGEADELRKTIHAQPAIFINSVIMAKATQTFKPDMVCGHSLGELSALTAVRTLSFRDGLKLVQARAEAMQAAVELQPSTMAAVLGMEDEKVAEVCATIKDDIVVAANYNCPGQLVISGTITGVDKAIIALKENGARAAKKLNVAGAFHSPLMQPAKESFSKAIESITFKRPKCPVYQNVNALPTMDPDEIKQNIIDQLTSSVLWSKTITNMHEDGARAFIEVGPKAILTPMIRRITGREMAMHIDEKLL